MPLQAATEQNGQRTIQMKTLLKVQPIFILLPHNFVPKYKKQKKLASIKNA